MKDQYTALNELTRSLQLKYESAYDDEEPAVDHEKVSQHLKWSSFQSMALFDDMKTNPRGLEGHPVSAINVGAIEYEAESDVDPMNACEAVINQQPHVTRESDAGQEVTQEELVAGMAAAISVLIQGVVHIKLDVNKDVREVPPTRPIDIISCSAGEFRSLLVTRASKLQEQFGCTVLGTIWAQFKQFIGSYRKQSDFRRRVDEQADLTLEDAWKRVNVGGLFDLLTAFCVGLASIAPGNHTVEGDFSTLKRLSGPQRRRLSNYAIEGELQARQYFELMALADVVENDKAKQAAEVMEAAEATI